MLGSSATETKVICTPKFVPARARTHELNIMTIQFMSTETQHVHWVIHDKGVTQFV